jgi:P-type Mg2+ transporter
MADKKLKFWALSSDEVLSYLGTSLSGLSGEEVGRRLMTYRGYTLNGKEKYRTLKLLFSQFKSPILWILLFAIGISFFLGECFLEFKYCKDWIMVR